MAPGTRSGRPAGTLGVGGPNFTDRPMTNQGVKGVRPMTGLKGAVQDKNWFLADLRNKRTALETEIAKINKELGEFEASSENYNQYEAKADQLNVEIKQLRGQLDDYNMLVDKIHTDTEVTDIIKQTNRLKDENEQKRKRIDDIFRERSGVETRTRQVESEISTHQQRIEQELNNLNPEILDAYRANEGENKKYLEKIEGLQRQERELQQRIVTMQEQLRQDPVKQKALVLFDKITELKARQRELQADAEQAKDGGPEEHKRLLQQVKDDNVEIATMDRRIAEIQEAIYRTRDRVVELERAREAQQGEKYEKYLQIVDKEKQMQQFIEQHPALVKEKEEEIAKAEETVVALLEHISSGLERRFNIPDSSTVRDMEDKLQFQQEQMQNATRTMDSLDQERRERQADLKKLGQLDKKIQTELDEIQRRIPEMNEELTKFSDVNTLKADSRQHERDLTEERTRLQRRREAIKLQVQNLQDEEDQMRRELKASEIFSTLKGKQDTLRVYLESNHELQEYIDKQGMESDYQARLKDVTFLLDEVNELVKESARYSVPL